MCVSLVLAIKQSDACKTLSIHKTNTCQKRHKRTMLTVHAPSWFSLLHLFNGSGRLLDFDSLVAMLPVFSIVVCDLQT